MSWTGMHGRQQTALKVFIAFPSDVRDLRDRVEGVVEELDEIAKNQNVRLDRWAWDTDAYPDFHPEEPQALIDPHVDDCEVLIGIFRTRLGASLPSGESGAQHEVRRAIAARHVKAAPRILLYFQEPTPKPGTAEEKTQLEALDRFKDEVRYQVLYSQYSDADSLEKKVRQHLGVLVHEVIAEQSKGRREPLPLAWSATAEPVRARSEGVAERMAQIGLTFTGGVPRSANVTRVILNIEARVTQNITNRLDARSLTDTRLLVFDRGSEIPLHAVAGRLVSDDAVLFEGIPFDPPGADARRYMRIINVRANAQASGDFGTIFGTVDVRSHGEHGLQLLPVNSVVALADSMPSRVVLARLPGAEFSRAEGVNLSLIRGGEGARFAAHLVFTEGFPGAYTTRGHETAYAADCGSRFLARFAGFPLGVRLFVSQFNLPGPGKRLRAGAARLVAADDAGVTSDRYRVREPSPVLVEGSPVVEISNGVPWAVWELIEAGPAYPGASREQIHFGIAVASEPGRAQLGMGTASGALAPLSTVYRASTTSPIPGFIDKATYMTLFTVVP